MKSKVCKACNQEKSIELFHERQTYCKDCKSKYMKKYRIANKESLKEYDKKYYNTNKEYYKESNKKYRIANKESLKEYYKEYCIANKEHVKKYYKKYYNANKEHVKKYYKKYYNANKHIMTAKSNKRRAKKLQATPSWLTKEHLNQIMEYYKLAKELQWLSEEILHVDHIIPLQGKFVCGLHVPWNLQILPASMNLSKSNNV